MITNLYFIGGGSNSFNSIYIQEKRIVESLSLSYLFNPIYISNINSSEIKKLIKNKEPIIWQYSCFTKELLFFKKNNNILFVYHNITPAKFFFFNEPLVAFKALLGRWQLKFMKKNLKWIAVSEYNQSELRKYGYSDVKYCPNIISADKSIVEEKTSLPSIIYVGRIVQNKNISTMLDIIYDTSIKLNEKLTFYLVGNGKEASFYYKNIKSKILLMMDNPNLQIIWYKNINASMLTKLYQKAWLYFSMSKHEGFGMPVCESILNRTPALYSKCGGQECVLNNYGLLNEKIKISETLVDYLNDKKKLKRLLSLQQNIIKKYISPNVDCLVKEAYSDFMKINNIQASY